MDKKKGSDTVDKEFKEELELMEERLSLSMEKLITSLITSGMKEIKSSLAELFNKDIDHIRETQERHALHHDSHFANISNVKDSIDPKIHSIVDDKFKLLETQINAVREGQLTCQAKERVTDKIEEKQDRKKELSMGMVVLICTIVGVMFAGITLLIN